MSPRQHYIKVFFFFFFGIKHYIKKSGVFCILFKFRTLENSALRLSWQKSQNIFVLPTTTRCTFKILWSLIQTIGIGMWFLSKKKEKKKLACGKLQFCWQATLLFYFFSSYIFLFFLNFSLPKNIAVYICILAFLFIAIDKKIHA